MVYRKYTKDFDSLGFRFGVTVDLEGGDPRDSWYQGRLFLGERIKEEEKLVIKKFEWLAKKKKIDVKSESMKGVELVEIPKLMEIPKSEKKVDKRSFVWVEDSDDAYHRIMFETNFKKDDIERQIERAKGMGISEKNALIEFAGEHEIYIRFKDSKPKVFKEVLGIGYRIRRIMKATGLTKDVIEKMVEGKIGDLKGKISRDGAIFVVEKELGVDIK